MAQKDRMRMIARGWVTAAALAALSACGRSPEPAEPVGAETTPAIAAPGPLKVPIATETSPPAPSVEASAPAEPSGIAASATPSPSGRLASYPPRDECAKVPGFPAFRDKLFAAAKARDAAAVVALADPAVHLDFGGGAGTEELAKRLADPKAPLWGEIAALDGLGCAVDGPVATGPWIFARLPDTVSDASATMLGLGSELALRDKPALASKPRRTLAWPLLELTSGFDPKARFSQVRLADGTRGYVETARLRSLLDYRLVAERKGSAWAITALIAGD